MLAASNIKWGGEKRKVCLYTISHVAARTSSLQQSYKLELYSIETPATDR